MSRDGLRGFFGPPPDRLIRTAQGFEFASWRLGPDDVSYEFAADPNPETHMICFGAAPFQAQAFKDGRHVLSGQILKGSCQIMEAGVRARKILSGEVAVTKAFIPVAQFRAGCEAEGVDPTTSLSDPLGRVIPELARWSDHVSTVLDSATFPPSRLWLDGAALQLIALLIRHCSSARSQSARQHSGLPPRALRLVMEFVEENLVGDFGLSELAELTGLSAKHFSRAFRQSTGVPPYRFVIERRIALARRMLRDTRMPLVEVALACGFSDQSHFTSTFRKLTGQTPGAYRRSREL